MFAMHVALFTVFRPGAFNINIVQNRKFRRIHSTEATTYAQAHNQPAFDDLTFHDRL